MNNNDKDKRNQGNNPHLIMNRFYTNIITDNITLSDGSVINKEEDNAALARERVNDIRL